MWKELFPNFQELGVTDRVDVGACDIDFLEILFIYCDLINGVQMDLIFGIRDVVSKHVKVVMHPRKAMQALRGVFGHCHLPLPQIQRWIQMMPSKIVTDER